MNVERAVEKIAGNAWRAAQRSRTQTSQTSTGLLCLIAQYIAAKAISITMLAPHPMLYNNHRLYQQIILCTISSTAWHSVRSAGLSIDHQNDDFQFTGDTL
ncbi:hypothetical protein J6590_038952 [Homalodisca vitripennis]|nr:hypothetical protein J6590_038952 [Homalodisca vitripennis]